VVTISKTPKRLNGNKKELNLTALPEGTFKPHNRLAVSKNSYALLMLKSSE
jgi:hypothetical protein